MLTGIGAQWVGRSYLTWSDIERDVKTLACKVQKTGFQFEKIATISRGGMVPSRLMADYLDVKIILVDKHHIPPKTLFVDDIYDSGRTFKEISARFDSGDFTYATLVARKRKTYPRQLLYARKTKGREYIVFPWEKNENKRQAEIRAKPVRKTA